MSPTTHPRSYPTDSHATIGRLLPPQKRARPARTPEGRAWLTVLDRAVALALTPTGSPIAHGRLRYQPSLTGAGRAVQEGTGQPLVRPGRRHSQSCRLSGPTRRR